FQNEEKALDAWAYTYTPEFQNLEIDVRKDSNGEPLASDVIKHSENENSAAKTRSKQDVVEIMESGLPVENTAELLSKLKSSLFKDGIFSISAESLRETGLYTEKEIAKIMYTPQLQQSIHSLISRMQEQTIPLKGDEILLTTQEGYTALGKLRKNNPF